MGKDSEKHYKALYEGVLASVPFSLLLLDRRLRVIFANRNFLEKARRGEATTLGKPIHEVFDPVILTSTKLEQRTKEVLNSGEPFTGGQMSRLPGLPGRVYFYRLTPLPDEQGTVRCVVLLMEDITEQKRLNQEMQRAERHLASVVESANDIMASMDSEGKILTWNSAAVQISGFTSAEATGRHLATLCSAEYRESMKSTLQQLVEGRDAKRTEMNLVTKAGHEVPVAWAFSPMKDDEGHIAGIVAVGRDLTETRQLQSQLVQSAKMASLGVMAGGIAHEIRNPLSIAMGAAQLLLREPDNEELRKACTRKIYQGVQRASHIIENLLKFARPPQQTTLPTNIHETLEDTLSLLSDQLNIQHITLKKNLAANLPKVLGNAHLLQQVFTNLVLNAINAMPEGGTLTITTRVESNDQVEIRVTDTGCGIPQENLERMFVPFFTTRAVGQGTGLGLAISYSIIKQHGGSIEVSSQVRHGTTFIIRLPRYQCSESIEVESS